MFFDAYNLEGLLRPSRLIGIHLYPFKPFRIFYNIVFSEKA
jgi:hypothetical protein